MFKNEGGSKIKLIDFSLTRKFDPQQETKISFGTAEFVGKSVAPMLKYFKSNSSSVLTLPNSKLN